MAWAVHPEWQEWTGKIKDEVDAVIRTMSRFEPVRLLTAYDQLDDARSRFWRGNIQIIEAPVDDIWMRDIAPTFVRDFSEVAVLDLNFNGWETRKEDLRGRVTGSPESHQLYSAFDASQRRSLQQCLSPSRDRRGTDRTYRKWCRGRSLHDASDREFSA
jgi:hypothetical protein